MALQGPIPVEFGTVFPAGVYAAGEFEPVRGHRRPTHYERIPVRCSRVQSTR
jgi:hypothetical protein